MNRLDKRMSSLIIEVVLEKLEDDPSKVLMILKIKKPDRLVERAGIEKWSRVSFFRKTITTLEKRRLKKASSRDN